MKKKMFNLSFIKSIMKKKTSEDLPKLEDVKDASFTEFVGDLNLPTVKNTSMDDRDMRGLGAPSTKGAAKEAVEKLEEKGELRHVAKALVKMDEANPDSELLTYISIECPYDEKGIVPSVTFKVQSDPISEVGVNGVQASEIIEFSKCLIESLNDMFPCRENEQTIKSLTAALMWQTKRTENRIARGVEGTNVN